MYIYNIIYTYILYIFIILFNINLILYHFFLFNILFLQNILLSTHLSDINMFYEHMCYFYTFREV